MKNMIKLQNGWSALQWALLRMGISKAYEGMQQIYSAFSSA